MNNKYNIISTLYNFLLTKEDYICELSVHINGWKEREYHILAVMIDNDEIFFINAKSEKIKSTDYPIEYLICIFNSIGIDKDKYDRYIDLQFDLERSFDNYPSLCDENKYKYFNNTLRVYLNETKIYGNNWEFAKELVLNGNIFIIIANGIIKNQSYCNSLNIYIENDKTLETIYYASNIRYCESWNNKFLYKQYK